MIEKTNCLRKNNVKIILHQEVLEKYKPSNYDKILRKCKTIKHIKEGLIFPKCPFCGEDVKIRHTNPLKFTQTCCKKECVKKIHQNRRDEITGLFKNKK